MFLAGFLTCAVLFGLVGGITMIFCKQSGMDSRAEEIAVDMSAVSYTPCRHNDDIACPYACRDGVYNEECDCDYFKSVLAEMEGCGTF